MVEKFHYVYDKESGRFYFGHGNGKIKDSIYLEKGVDIDGNTFRTIMNCPNSQTPEIKKVQEYYRRIPNSNKFPVTINDLGKKICSSIDLA